MSSHDAERGGDPAELDGFHHVLDPDFIRKLANELYAGDDVRPPTPTPAPDSTSVPEIARATANGAGSHDRPAEDGYPHLPADLATLSGGNQEIMAAASGHETGLPQPDYRNNFAGMDSADLPSVAQRFGLQRYYFLPETPLPTATPLPASGFDVDAVRQDFPALHQTVHGKRLIWLDNAATSQKPQCVIDALERYYRHDNSNVHRGAHTLAARATEAYEGARRTVQHFLGARSEREIVFVRGTTEAINLVAQTYGRKYVGAGDEIILTTLEHHSNIVPWQMLAQEKGAVIRVVPVDDAGNVMLDEYDRLLGPRTKLVAMTHVSNVLGTVLPIEAMTRAAHRYGARVLVDGAQSVPHTRVNVQELGSDFYVFSSHKLFGPTGIGALYGREEILEAMPPWQGGGSMIKAVSFEESTYADVPARFEAGTPNIADAVGLGAAIDYLERIGFDAAIRYEEELTAYGMRALAGIPGLRQIGTAPHKLSVLSFVLDGIPTEDVGRFLDREGIAVRAGHHCAQPTMRRYGVTGTVRPALALYNTREEIDALTIAVTKAQRELSAK